MSARERRLQVLLTRLEENLQLTELQITDSLHENTPHSECKEAMVANMLQERLETR
jgi:hypothetical protein